jgi:hypothetical protein
MRDEILACSSYIMSIPFAAILECFFIKHFHS